ncbi:hypothetical protein A3Q56_07803 [Intoshia linei]|uniref:Uncharacterized protein n=1 Tax=Intoshia linei TaxID=1819745 RepID=A0A177AR26_9BILA|nr:hypothetical protein A3Q56_07803 [Intoshia linei]
MDSNNCRVNVIKNESIKCGETYKSLTSDFETDGYSYESASSSSIAIITNDHFRKKSDEKTKFENDEKITEIITETSNPTTPKTVEKENVPVDHGGMKLLLKAIKDIENASDNEPKILKKKKKKLNKSASVSFPKRRLVQIKDDNNRLLQRILKCAQKLNYRGTRKRVKGYKGFADSLDSKNQYTFNQIEKENLAILKRLEATKATRTLTKDYLLQQYQYRKNPNSIHRKISNIQARYNNYNYSLPSHKKNYLNYKKKSQSILSDQPRLNIIPTKSNVFLKQSRLSRNSINPGRNSFSQQSHRSNSKSFSRSKYGSINVGIQKLSIENNTPLLRVNNSDMGTSVVDAKSPRVVNRSHSVYDAGSFNKSRSPSRIASQRGSIRNFKTVHRKSINPDVRINRSTSKKQRSTSR